jgi:hypothetical protein
MMIMVAVTTKQLITYFTHNLTKCALGPQLQNKACQNSLIRRWTFYCAVRFCNIYFILLPLLILRGRTLF